MPLSTEAARFVFECQTPGAVSTLATTLDIDAGFTVDPEDLVEDVAGIFDAQLMTLTTDEWTHFRTTLYVPVTGGSIPYIWDNAIPGPSGTPTSAAVSLLLTKRTAVGGRRGKGRMFLCPPPNTQVNADGTVAAGFLATARTKAAAFLAGIVALDPTVQPVVHTRASGGLPSGNTLITSMTIEGEVATQRKRQRR